MKKSIISILLFLITLSGFSQDIYFPSTKEKNQHKQIIFGDYSDKGEVHPNFFNSLPNIKKNDKVNLTIMDKMVFKGVVKILNETDDYRTLSIDSDEVIGLRLIIAHTKENKYYGIIASINHKDMFVLKEDEDQKRYFWIKKELSDLIPD